ncbi:MAG: hypothetical protein DLM73_02915 [Chthoniobacterales bacterium]|nr:MAG: hypothetical protein DLM73_02915 [Chthoniobacterales bacterium]
MSFIRTGLREIGLKIRRQKTRMALRHEKRVLQRSEINLGREGVSQAVNFPEVRNEIVALKKLEQEQKEVALRISQIEEGIRKIELQRDQNTKEQNEALAKLDEEKKPVLQRRNEAKAAADICDRELASVERRLQDNDAADRDLLKKLAELQAQVPPPDDLEAQMAGISGRRVRLPEERAEVTRARMGSAEACRMAREKLNEQDAALAAMDKNIARIREEFEARDRVLNEQSRTQQEALKDARGHHQVVEEKKNPAYLNIGRHLASQGIAPPNAPQLLAEVQKHRAAVERHSQHTAELAVLSSQIDKQEIRKFYFAIISVLILLAIIVPLVFQSPQKREWLPQETEAILSVNLEQLEKEDLPKRWRKDQAAEWQNIWTGLIGGAQRTPVLNLPRDGVRVTRAMAAIDAGTPREFVLVEAHTDVSRVINSIEKDKSFERRTISGLPMWMRPDFALARVGPRTLAIGAEREVATLARVRLGIDPDLKITGPLFDRFQSLKEGNALRLVSRDPPNLSRIFQPVFNSELLSATELLGLSLTLQSPVKARLILQTKSTQAAGELAARIRNEPQRWLRLQDSDLLLYAQTPEVEVQGANVQMRFDVPENSARVLLQRIAKTNSTPIVAGN